MHKVPTKAARAVAMRTAWESIPDWDRIDGFTARISVSYTHLDVYKRQDVCTLIDVNEQERKVKIRNYTDRVMFRAFGTVENPDYKDYQEFLESRCFPESRDKMKLILKDLGLPFYDPIMIIEKTEGRMAEDNFWVRIER